MECSGRISRRILELVVVGCSLVLPGADGQAGSGASPRFTLASLKLTNEPSHRNPPVFHTEAGRIDYRMIGTKSLVLKAWPLDWYQIVWPEGMPIAFYDVAATMPGRTTSEQLQLMLQRLLAERLGLRSHWETRNLPLYSLELSGRGLKIHKSLQTPPASSSLVMQTNRSLHPTKRLPDSTAFTIGELLQLFRKWLDRPMIDHTGLEGFYDVDLRVPCGPDGCTDSSWNNSVFFDALEMQLGLKVEQKTLPTKMLVIDHLNRVPAPI
jgi:uncharacterized protein (TIGR03435 family)